MAPHQKKAESQPAVDQISLQTLFDGLPAYIKIGDPDGNFDFFNQQWLDYTGLSLAEVKGMSWISAIHPDDVAEVSENWRHSVSTGTPVYHESRVRRFDGEYHWFLHRHVPIRDPKGRIIKWIGTSIDIEDRKRAEQRAIESEKDFRRSIDTIPALIFTALPDGELDFSNLRSLEFSGHAIEDFRQWRWTENGIVHAEDVPILLEALRAAILSKEPFEIEARLRRFDGQYRWFRVGVAPLLDESGEVIRWCGASIDIDDQKQAEARIRRNEQELRQIIDLVPQQIFVLSPDGTAVYWNRVALEYSRLTLEESLSNDVPKKMFHPDEAEWVINETRRKIKLGIPFELEGRIRRHDGQYRWFLIRLNPLRDENGRIVHWYLEKAVAEKTFREDLFYRLNVFPIHIPPLRERREDIPLLIEYFVRKYAKKIGREINAIPRSVLSTLENYSWPGNIRELENIIERSVILCRGHQLEIGNWFHGESQTEEEKQLRTLVELERAHILKVLDFTHWRVSGPNGAAQILGLNSQTLVSRMKKLGIQRMPSNEL